MAEFDIFKLQYFFFSGLFYLFSASCLLPRAFPAETDKHFLCEWVKFFQQKEQEMLSACLKPQASGTMEGLPANTNQKS